MSFFNLTKVKMERRFTYLDSEITDENPEIYLRTKELLKLILPKLHFSVFPFIGLTNEGQVIAEWHNSMGHCYSYLMPVSENVINYKIVDIGKSIVYQTFTLETIDQLKL